MRQHLNKSKVKGRYTVGSLRMNCTGIQKTHIHCHVQYFMHCSEKSYIHFHIPDYNSNISSIVSFISVHGNLSRKIVGPNSDPQKGVPAFFYPSMGSLFIQGSDRCM